MIEKDNAIKKLTLSDDLVIKKIHTLRRIRVMVDSDLAELYCVPVKALNQGEKRNKERFPDDFMFQFNEQEYDSLRFQFDTSKSEIFLTC